MLRLPCPRATAPAPRPRPGDPDAAVDGDGPVDGFVDGEVFALDRIDVVRPPQPTARALERAAELERCDAYVVVVADPVTGAVDSYGPYEASRADREVARRRRELDAEGLTDVSVQRVRHHRPE